MTNAEAIKKIDKTLTHDYHFTDYDFGGMNDFTGKKCPRPEKIEWLVEQFSCLMNNLKDFLKSNPDKDSLSKFLIIEVKNIDSKFYREDEFELLLLKYDMVPCFGLHNGIVMNYYAENKETFNYLES